MNKRDELESKIAEFEIERENRLASMGESRWSEDMEREEGPPGGQGQPKPPWDRQKPKKGTYPAAGPNGPGDLNIEGNWEGPIELFEFEDIDEGWVNCTTGYYWHSVLGGGICQYADEWYRNWEFDYKPPENEVVSEEFGEAPQEVPEVPQNPPDDKVTTKQTKDMEGEKSTASHSSSAQQSQPTQIKPQGSSLLTKNPLAPLSPEESKTRENNIAHMKHLREAMKKGLEKWDDEIREEKDQLNKVGMENDRERLNGWLENFEMILRATEMSPVYVPTVKEEWIRAAKQKPTSSLEIAEEPLPQPNKPKGLKLVRKHVAKKSWGRRQKAGDKSESQKEEPQQQSVDLEDQPEEIAEEPGEEPLPQGSDPKDSQLLGTDSKNLSTPKPKPKGTGNKPKGPKLKPKGAKPNEPVPKNTTETISEEQTTWYKTGVAYDTKHTGPAATPPEGLLNVTRKCKAGGQPKPSTPGGPSANKRKRTTPAKWMSYTQPRTTYLLGNKITPAWGLTHRGDMDPTDDWSVPLYTPPKPTERQEAARKEAQKKKKKYRRYKPGQLALKEINITKRNLALSYPLQPLEGSVLRLVTIARKVLVSNYMHTDFCRKLQNVIW